LIDATALLATWRQRLAAISANTNELSEAESTKRIRIKAREGRYRGPTLQRAEQAIALISSLRDDYLLLAGLVDEAAQAHQGGLFTSRESRDEKVVALLCSPSIARSAGLVPLEKRTLLGAANQHDQITPEQLLQLMQDEFENARDLLCRIDAAEEKGALELDGLRRDFAGMAERAARLNADASRPSFIELQDLQSDPLNAQGGMASLKRGLQAWATSLDELEQVRSGAKQAVACAEAALAQLNSRCADLAALVRQVQELYGASAGATLQLVPATQVEMLHSWCETLESLLLAGQWHAVNVGAGRLNAALDEAIGNVNRAVAEAQARCAAAQDVNGHFLALRAKEKALLGTGGEAHAALRERIDAALQARPLNLDAVRALLLEYQNVLLAESRRT
jgi:DNA repair exonuclease SbcCD ATPase subunit